MPAPADRPFTDHTLRRARKGKRSALEQMWTAWNPPLLRFFRARNAPDPEDLAQQVWLEVAAKLPDFDGDARAFRRWLFTLAHRRLIDGARRRSARPSEPVSHQPERLEAAATGPTPEAAVDELDWAMSLVSALPDTQAAVVVLRTVAGLSTDDVAQVIGKSPGAVRVLHHRGLRRLEALLAADEVADEHPIERPVRKESDTRVTPANTAALTPTT